MDSCLEKKSSDVKFVELMHPVKEFHLLLIFIKYFDSIHNQLNSLEIIERIPHFPGLFPTPYKKTKVVVNRKAFVFIFLESFLIHSPVHKTKQKRILQKIFRCISQSGF